MKRIILILSIAAILLLWASPVGQGQRNTWSRPLRLGDGWFPDVAADVSGRVHLVYASATGDSENYQGYDIVMYTSSPDGVKWSTPNDIGARPQVGGSEATRPYLIADNNHTLHLTFRDTTVFYAQANALLAAQSNHWSIKPISEGYFSVVALDSQNRIHLVYTDNVVTDQCPICYHVYHTYSDDNGATWSAHTDVSTLPTGSAKPRLVIDDQDQLYLIWEAGIGGSYGQLIDPTSVVYTFSTDRGETWGLPMPMSPVNERARHPGIGLDGDEKVIAVWLAPQTDLVYYRLSEDRGRTFTPAAPIPNTFGGWNVHPGRLDHYVLERDSLGHLHLVLVGRIRADQRHLDLLHLVWDGQNWSTPEVIASFYGDVPEWPEMAIANGNQLHVTWFIRPEAYIWSGGYASQIWYAQRTLDAPRIEPHPLPTLTPIPSPTPEPTRLIPTVDPLSDDVVLTEALGFYGNITTENDEVFLIFQSLIPSLLLIGLVVAVTRRLRH